MRRKGLPMSQIAQLATSPNKIVDPSKGKALGINDKIQQLISNFHTSQCPTFVKNLTF
jgi:hypothetical protein